VLHLFIASLFCLLVSISVIRSVATMTPQRTYAQSIDDCREQGWLLWESLEKERKNLVFPELKTANDWTEYRAHWITQLEMLQKSCSEPESQKLFKTLRKLMEVYNIHMTAFVQDLALVVPTMKSLQP
jgi:hypothetical protein